MICTQLKQIPRLSLWFKILFVTRLLFEVFLIGWKYLNSFQFVPSLVNHSIRQKMYLFNDRRINVLLSFRHYHINWERIPFHSSPIVAYWFFDPISSLLSLKRSLIYQVKGRKKNFPTNFILNISIKILFPRTNQNPQITQFTSSLSS